VPAELSGVQAVAAGYYHTVALLNTGQVAVWGSQYFIPDTSTAPEPPVEGRYRISWENTAGRKGWYNPLGTGAEIWTHSNYDFDSQVYLDNWGKRHAGVDIVASEDTAIHAVADGTVVSIYSSGTYNEAVLVQHHGREGAFYAVYGHIARLAGIGTGSPIGCGQVIGNVRGGGDPDHLHFGINVSENVDDFVYGDLGWGRVPENIEPEDVGWRDPIPYLSSVFNEGVFIIPGSYNFGSVAVGQTQGRNFSVTNAGSGNVIVGDIEFSGANASDFYVSNDNVSNSVLAPGASASVTVHFRPSADGLREGSLDIPYGTGTATAALQGTGGAAGASTLTGFVYDGSTGSPLPGTTVTLGDDSTDTDAQGGYAFTGLTAGSYTLLAEKSGYNAYSASVDIPASSGITKNITLYPESATGVNPRVNSVGSKFSGLSYFLDGVNFNVTWTANVDWAGNTPGKVRFITPEDSYDVATSTNSASKQFNMGTEFGHEGKLKVVAISADNKTSAEKEADFVVMKSLPLSFNSYDTGSNFNYKISAGPNWEFINEGIGAGVIPSTIPYFGGKEFNIRFIPTIKAGIKSNTASLGLAFEGTIPAAKIAGFSIGATPYVGITGDYSDTAWSFYGNLGMDIGFSGTTPPWYLPVPIVPVYVQGTLKVSADINAEIHELLPLPPELLGYFVLNPEVKGSLGVGVSRFVSAEVWIGGGAEAALQFPQEPHLEEIVIYVNCGYTLYAFGMNAGKGELPLGDWMLYGDKTVGTSPFSPEIPQWQPVSRTYLSKPDYGAFRGGRDYAVKTFTTEEETYTVFTASLQENVFPYSEPYVSSEGGHLYLTWLYDNPEREDNNRTAAVFSSYTGTEWTEPVVIDDDGTADFQSGMEVFPDGSAIAAWTSGKHPLADDATFDQMLNNLEIKAAHYDPATNEWHSTQTLTDNNYLDASPLVSGTDKDDVMVIWTANETNNLLGDADNPNKVYYGKWDGTSWTTGLIAIVANPIIKYDFAYDGNKGNLVLSKDIDGDIQTVEDRELCLLTYESGAWSELVRLTTDDVPDDNPKLAYDPSGNTVLVWLKGDEISSAVNFDMEERQVVRETKYSSHIGDFKLASSIGGRLALVWPEPSEYSSDIWSVFYDPVFNLWGNPKQLTENEETEKWITACFYGDDTLFAVYNRTELEEKKIARKRIDGKTSMLSIPKPGDTDLYVLQYTMGDDVALAQHSFSVDPANPSIGQLVTFSVTAVNLGDNPVSVIPVAFYEGDPAEEGERIDEVLIEGVLAPGESREILCDWIVPETTQPIDIYAFIDPDYIVEADSNRLNNLAQIRIVKADLAVGSISVQNITDALIYIETTVVNIGSLPSTETTLTFRKDAVDGELLLEETIPALDKDESVSVGSFYDAGLMKSAVKSIWAVADEGDVVEEFSKTNNVSRIYTDYKYAEQGDINGDEEINISDVILCLRMAIGLPITIGDETYEPPDKYPQWLIDTANMNEDEDVNISDVILILRKAIGLEE
jgi:murein DD-endopeptidase MepM/ murein hydrolase activator NlpD